jgi:hypothetical protein
MCAKGGEAHATREPRTLDDSRLDFGTSARDWTIA